MYINDVNQINIILMSVGLGTLLAVLYDVYTVINKLSFKSCRTIVLRDVIFCLLSGLICFLFLLVVNRGRMRFYFLPGSIIGFYCWHFSLSELFVNLLSLIFIRISDLFQLSGRLFLLPFRPIIALLSLIYGKLDRLFKKYFIKLKNKLKIDLKKI